MQGLIIDERWNGGGMIPHRFIELLNRPVRSYWATRDGKSWRTPYRTHPGPKVMLINHAAGSGGDAFPYYFRQAGLGPLVGTRTWGGLVGIWDYPELVDGGRVTAPRGALFPVRGKWEIENQGVAPDVEVEQTPADVIAGKDPQLEKAIALVMAELAKSPPVAPKRPPIPQRARTTAQ